MSEIILGHSFYLRLDAKLWEARQPYPPLETLYAASCLRGRGYNVALFDATLAESPQEWKAALDAAEPRCAVIYEDNFNYPSKMCLLRMRHASFSMIRGARERGCTVVVAGSDATTHPEMYLGQGADFVVTGEGEFTLLELVDRLMGRTRRPYREIRGLAFCEDDARQAPGGSTVHRTQRRPLIDALDALPFPARDLIDIGRYKRIWLRRHGRFSMNVVTSRGCPFHCNWCAKPIWGDRHHIRSPENVVAELVELKAIYQPDHIWFADDIMGLERGWLYRFADLVDSEDVRIPFKCLSRPDLLLRDGEISALRRAGCDTVWLGAESGAQPILDAMEKGTRVEQIYEAARRLQATGIRVGFFLQFGYPGETRVEIGQTIRMVRDCRPDDIGISVSYPLPGTKLYDRVKDEMGSQRNWQDAEDLAMLYRGAYPTGFYRQLHLVVHKEFRVRAHWAKLRGLVQRPDQLERSHLRHVGALLYHAMTLPLARWRLDRLEARTAHPRPV